MGVARLSGNSAAVVLEFLAVGNLVPTPELWYTPTR